MIPRYTPDDIGALWTEAHRVRTWLDVEVAACEAMAAQGLLPVDDVKAIRAAADGCDTEKLAERALEIEAVTKHDVIAFLTAFEEVAGPVARHVHYGMTSSDVLDTSLGLRLVQAADIIEQDLLALREAVKVRAEEHRKTPMMGRSHGIHAEPITFGLVMAGWYAELTRSVRRLRQARDEIRCGKISGAVGTSAHLPLAVETQALAALGLQPEPVATQVVARDRHAQFFGTLATIAASVERFSVEVRHLQRTEVREAEEPFTKGQKGSSAMPHKRNPILTENLTGLARLVRGWAQAAYENVALWHERDISHSSVERVIAPDATITVVFMVRRMKRVVEGLVVYPERMMENLQQMRGLVFSQPVLLELTRKGLQRQESYVIVQRAAMRVWDEGLDLKSALLADEELMSKLKPEELEPCFDLSRHLANVDALIDRALAEAP
ncbi:MAG: adenylosuccinate lyase [Myxococcales bacterium]|nr:adenylosuccinate lyase [Myxococcales bacterium]